MNAETFLNDIPLETATRAFSGISFTPEKRGESTRNGYGDTLAADYASLKAIIANKPELAETLESEFERYRQGYKRRYLAKLHTDSRIVSFMIAGPSNFPVRQMEKRNRVAHKRLEELLAFRERALDAIAKTLCPELRPIMSGDADAVERLQKEIEEAEILQGRMKAANAIVRKFFKDPVNGCAELEKQGFTVEQAQKLFQPGFGGYGFASFKLTNNNANLRRMKQRLAHIQANKQLANSERTGENGIRVEDCPSENRIKLFFPGKPEEAVRSRLKSNGFRWSPTGGCWQAYRNNRAMECAKREAGFVQKAA